MEEKRDHTPTTPRNQPPKGGRVMKEWYFGLFTKNGENWPKYAYFYRKEPNCRKKANLRSSIAINFERVQMQIC